MLSALRSLINTKVAYGEVTYLWSLLGYDPCEAPINSKSLGQLGNSNSVPEAVDDADSEGYEESVATSDCKELLVALEASSNSLGPGSVSRTGRDHLNKYVFAAAALNLQDFNNLCVHINCLLSNE